MGKKRERERSVQMVAEDHCEDTKLELVSQVKQTAHVGPNQPIDSPLNPRHLGVEYFLSIKIFHSTSHLELIGKLYFLSSVSSALLIFLSLMWGFHLTPPSTMATQPEHTDMPGSERTFQLLKQADDRGAAAAGFFL